MGERPEWAPEKIFVLDTQSLDLMDAQFEYLRHDNQGAMYSTMPGHPWLVLWKCREKLEAHVLVEETGDDIGPWFRTRKELLEKSIEAAETIQKRMKKFICETGKELARLNLGEGVDAPDQEGQYGEEA